MGHHILLAYLSKNPIAVRSDLINIYTYFKFKAYLQTTLRCTRKAFCIKAFKAANEVSSLPQDELYELSDALAAHNAHNPAYDLLWAVEQLEQAQAEVIKMYYFKGMTDLEISRVRNVSRQAVNNLKHRALSNLRNILGECI